MTDNNSDTNSDDSDNGSDNNNVSVDTSIASTSTSTDISKLSTTSLIEAFNKLSSSSSTKSVRPTTSKRKRKQSGEEKSNKRKGKETSRSASTANSIKPCPTCANQGVISLDYSRSSNKKCPFHRQSRLKQLKDDIGATTRVVRKIGLNSLNNMENQDDKISFINAINVAVEYIRNIIIKQHLFIMYYVYSKLTNGEFLSRSIYNFSFFYSTFQLITQNKFTRNNVVNGHFAGDLQKVFNDCKAVNPNINVPYIAGFSYMITPLCQEYVTKFQNRLIEDSK